VINERISILGARRSPSRGAAVTALCAVTFPVLDPVLLSFGPIEIRWYGVMYLLGFAVGYVIIRSELKRRGDAIACADAEDLLFYCVAGLLIGARLGYALFYNFPVYASQPWLIVAVWQGGMSFHGGLVGLLVAGLLYSRKSGAAFLELADIGALAAPPGLMLGRLGNFINGELFGRTTDAAWGIVFPLGGPVPRHPSQLYEAVLEGPVLFAILWLLRTRVKDNGLVLAAFLVLYGMFRFFIEFFRQPDAQLGFIVSGLTMGQLLCACMSVAGALLFSILRLRGRRDNAL
jgi:phosphatidylglycerol:prolipoprotein diacylglycerol transferase